LPTYAEFQSYLKNFADGGYQFLWVVGRPGTGKSKAIRAAISGCAVYYRTGGQLTPLQFYLDCHANRNKPIILDDGEHLLENKLGAKLVSALADTARVKELCYGTTSRALGEVPKVFFTTSPLCLIANRVTLDTAILSRAVVLHFDPTNSEIHRAVASWFWDQPIHDWFGEHLARLEPLDARWYLHAAQDKQAGRDWAQILLRAHALDRASVVIQDLEIDPTCPTREDKADRFVASMAGTKGASRATYFRLHRRLVDNDQMAIRVVSPITLRRTRPPGQPSQLELDSMAAGFPPPPDEDAPPVDVPARAEFVQPVRGAPQPPTATPPGAAARRSPLAADETVAWEPPEAAPEENEDAEE
jgi:hypothetical protein